MTGRPNRLCPRIAATVVAWAAFAGPTFALESGDELQSAVRRLGADEFSTRRNAGDLLLKAGPTAVPALRDALQSESPEVRYRASDLLQRIERQLLELQMADIAAGRPVGGTLPVWDRYSVMVGTDETARKLFVQMLERSPDLMLSIGTSGAQLEFEQSVGEWMNSTGRRRRQLDLNEAAVLMFAMIQPECRPAPAMANVVVQHLHSQQIRTELQGSEVGPTVKALMAEWVSQSEAAPALTRLSLAQGFRLREGRVPALELLRGGAPNTELQTALLFLGMYGEPEDIHDIELMLENDQQLTSASGSANAVTSEVGDVALAMLWKLNGQNPAQHGMATYTEHGGVPRPGTIGFAQKDERIKARAEWQAWRKLNVKSYLPVDGRAVEGAGI